MSAHDIPRVILYAEDDPNDVCFLERVVKRFFADHRLQTVSNGDDAIHYLRGDDPYADRTKFALPQLVILDINLPGTNGLEVLRWIREQPRLRRVIVLILTGSDSPDHIQQAYTFRANSFLKKRPFLLTPEISRAALEYWLNVNEPPVV